MTGLRSTVLALLVSAAAWAPLSAAADPPREKIVDRARNVEANLMSGAFDALEKTADDLRTTRARVAGGYWALQGFYYDLSAIVEDDCKCGHHGPIPFEDKRKAIERWLAAKPESLTAKIALADLWEEYAWAGDIQQPDFSNGLTKTLEILRPLDKSADPEIYALEMNAAMIADDPKAELLDLYVRASKAFPTYPRYAVARYNFTAERWYGKPGEAAAFASSLLSEPSGDEGLMLYFDVARTFVRNDTYWPTVFAHSGLSYATVVKAFVTRSNLFGVDNDDLNVMMFYACAAGDKKTAALLAQKIGDAWTAVPWGEKATYDSVVAWTRLWP